MILHARDHDARSQGHYWSPDSYCAADHRRLYRVLSMGSTAPRGQLPSGTDRRHVGPPDEINSIARGAVRSDAARSGPGLDAKPTAATYRSPPRCVRRAFPWNLLWPIWVGNQGMPYGAAMSIGRISRFLISIPRARLEERYSGRGAARALDQLVGRSSLDRRGSLRTPDYDACSAAIPIGDRMASRQGSGWTPLVTRAATACWHTLYNSVRARLEHHISSGRTTSGGIQALLRPGHAATRPPSYETTI